MSDQCDFIVGSSSSSTVDLFLSIFVSKAKRIGSVSEIKSY